MLQGPNPLASRRRQAVANNHREEIFNTLDRLFESVVPVDSHRVTRARATNQGWNRFCRRRNRGIAGPIPAIPLATAGDGAQNHDPAQSYSGLITCLSNCSEKQSVILQRSAGTVD
jgi:hypothetical protein